jgi:hypothetical protein
MMSQQHAASGAKAVMSPDEILALVDSQIDVHRKRLSEAVSNSDLLDMNEEIGALNALLFIKKHLIGDQASEPFIHVLAWGLGIPAETVLRDLERAQYTPIHIQIDPATDPDAYERNLRAVATSKVEVPE